MPAATSDTPHLEQQHWGALQAVLTGRSLLGLLLLLRLLLLRLLLRFCCWAACTGSRG
jgi:hypothetical protein